MCTNGAFQHTFDLADSQLRCRFALPCTVRITGCCKFRRTPFKIGGKRRFVVQELIASPPVRQLPRDRLHPQRQRYAAAQHLPEGIRMSAVIAEMQQHRQLHARHHIIQHRLMRIAVHTVFVKGQQLRCQLKVQKIRRITQPRVLPHPLAGGIEGSPVADALVRCRRDHLIARIRINSCKALPPSLRLRPWEQFCALKLQQRKNNFFHGKIIACTRGVRNFTTAEIHHFNHQ